MLPLKIGLLGIGLKAYWPQFPGLNERQYTYLDRLAVRLRRPGVEVVNLGLICDPNAAMEAGHVPADRERSACSARDFRSREPSRGPRKSSPDRI